MAPSLALVTSPETPESRSGGPTLDTVLDIAEKDLDSAYFALARADAILSSVRGLPDDVAKLGEDWTLSASALAEAARRAERLRQQRDRIVCGSGDPDERISVQELATGIGRTERTTRQLLYRGQIPGARRKTPGQKNSPWLIPRSSIAAFNNQREE